MSISYPSGVKETEIHDPKTAAIIKYVSLGLRKIAFRSLLKDTEIRDVAKKEVFKIIHDEVKHLSSDAGNSILRQTSKESLTDLKLEKIRDEFELKTPTLMELLQILCQSTGKENLTEHCLRKINMTTNIAAMIMFVRNPKLSALAHRNGIILRHAGTTRWVSYDNNDNHNNNITTTITAIKTTITTKIITTKTTITTVLKIPKH